MALLPCRECGREVSTEAATCPQCGAPKPATPLGTPQPLSTPPTQAVAESRTRRILVSLAAPLIVAAYELIVKIANGMDPWEALGAVTALLLIVYGLGRFLIPRRLRAWHQAGSAPRRIIVGVIALIGGIVVYASVRTLVWLWFGEPR